MKSTLLAFAAALALLASKGLAQAPVQDLPHAFPREGLLKRLENDRLVIWEYTWTLGKPTNMHFHDKDVAVVFMSNGELKSTMPDGKSDVRPIKFGQALFNPANRTHSEELVRGAGRAIIAEFK